MNEQLQTLWTKWATESLIPALFLAMSGTTCLSTGCSLITKNHGEIGVRYGTELTFFHRAAQTATEEATFSVDFPSLEEMLKASDEVPASMEP